MSWEDISVVDLHWVGLFRIVLQYAASSLHLPKFDGDGCGGNTNCEKQQLGASQVVVHEARGAEM